MLPSGTLNPGNCLPFLYQKYFQYFGLGHNPLMACVVTTWSILWVFNFGPQGVWYRQAGNEKMFCSLQMLIWDKIENR